MSLLTLTGAFSSSIMAASSSGSIRVSATVLPVCRLDNTSINFAERNVAHEVEAQALVPLSVTCKDGVTNGTHLLALTKPETVDNSSIISGTGPTGQGAVTIYYQ
ncbi:MAG: hypothetical protein ACI965_002130 [Paraglaciecola sp.]